MPIKGLTDRGLSFPEIGQIRKGGKKEEREKNGKKYEVFGKDLQYFRVEFDEKEIEAIGLFTAKYHEQPTEINIVLPFNEIERCWDAYLEMYDNTRMIARSDGEKFIYLVNKETGQIVVQNGIPFKKHENITGLKPTGRLKVIIPELQRLAYLTVMTTSQYDIANISAQLAAIQNVNGGQLAGIPLVLRRRPKKVSVPTSGGQRARVTKSLISIEADPGWVKAKLMELKQASLPGNGLNLLPDSGDVPALPEPSHIVYEDDEEDDIVTGEVIEEGEVSEPKQKVTRDTAKPERPYPPETLKKGIEHKGTQFVGKAASEKQRGLVASLLNECFAPSADADKIRHSVQDYLYGAKVSLKNAPDGFVLALIDWLKPVEDTGGAWFPSEMAVKEAQLVWKECQLAAGQTLFEMPPAEQ